MTTKSLSIVLVCLASILSVQAQFTTGLVAYYPFNGNANDGSGNGNNGTVAAATLATDRFGNNDSAYAFDGVSSLITVPDSPSLRITNDITVTCWVKFAETNTTVRLLGKGVQCNKNYGLWRDQGTSWMFQQFPSQGGCIGCQENTASATPSVIVDRWYQMVGVRSGSVSRLYLDGTLIQERSPTCSGSTYTGNESLLIGGTDPAEAPTQPPTTLMHGSLDEIRIYNRALSQQEVQQLYVYELTPRPYLTVSVKTIQLNMYVALGKTNQLESSTNFITWTAYGLPFLATNSVMYQDVDVLGGQQYFRIKEVSP